MPPDAPNAPTGAPDAPAAADDLAAYDYPLPKERIAQAPAERRDQSRLMVLDPTRAPGQVGHHRFAELPALLPPRALIIVNDTRVRPVRLRGRKDSGGAVELLLLEPETAAPLTWRALYSAAKPLRPGTRLVLGPPDAPVTATVAAREPEGRVLIAFERALDDATLEQAGEVPLPPYIDRAVPQAADRARYQTMFAEHAGAAAAPTAGLHFTPELMAALAAAGHDSARLTLHVGPGTFAPIREGIAAHRMHAERYQVPPATSAAIAAARAAGRPIVAVGTTVVRTLEAAHDAATSAPRPGPGATDIFIKPGYQFRAVDALVTNFHVPRSTLMLLVSALAGTAHIQAAYQVALAQGYRFLSYGDAMLIASPRAPR